MDNICTYCQSKSYTVQYSTFDIFGNNYEIAKCNNCQAYFLTPNPSKERLMQAYSDDYYGGAEDEEKFEGFIEKGLNYFRKQRARNVIRLTQGKGRILDIGCGNGQFLQHCSEISNVEIFGLEMEGSSANRAKKIKHIHLTIGELETDTYPKEYFDAITLFHVFEHLEKPIAYLDKIDQILKKEAYLTLSFPNIDSWQARFFKGKWLHLDPPRHLFFFSPKIFKALMQERSYDLLSEHYFSIEQNPYGAIQSWFNLFHKKRELLFESLKGNTQYTKNTNSTVLKIEKLLFVILMPLFIIIDILASVLKKSATVEFTFQKK